MNPDGEGMSDRPYVCIFHDLADTHPDLYDSSDLAVYIRLRVAADQSWPTSARWAGHATRKEVNRIEASGIITVDGPRFRMPDLDEDRRARSESASHAARMRWSNATRNADGNAPRNADRNAETMPNKAEQNKATQNIPEQAGEDVYDLYYRLTVRTPNKTVMDWLDRLVEDHGQEVVEQAMAAQWSANPSVKDFLGRVEMSCAKETKRRLAENGQRAKLSELEYQRSLREQAENATPEEKARAAEVRESLRAFVGGLK